MKSIIVARPLNANERLQVENLGSKSDYRVYSIREEQFDIPEVTEIDSVVNHNVNAQCLKEVAAFGHKIYKGKTIVEWLSFGGRTYWYYLRFSLYFYYLPRIKERNLLVSVSPEIGNHKVIIYSHYKHKLDFSSPDWLIPIKNKVSLVKSFKNAISFGIIFSVRALIGFFQFLFNWNKRHSIGLEPYVVEDILDINDIGHKIKGDYYNEYLVDKSSKTKDFVFISDFYFPKLNDDVKLDLEYFFNKYTKRSLNFEFPFIVNLFNPVLLWSTFKFRRNFRKMKYHLESEEHLMLKFIFKKRNILSVMFMRERVVAGLFKIKGIKTFTCHHEHSYHHRSFVRGAKRAGVKTIGFQHGTIHLAHIHYMYNVNDKMYDPIPEHMITWGEHWRDILINHSIYKESNTHSLGQIRTDIIPHLLETKVNIKPPINQSKMTVVLASQPGQIGVANRKKVGHDFLKLSKEYEQLNFVIKPHPREFDANEYYSEIANDLGTTNYQISKDDLYLVLNISDLVITFNSTVASEAVYFKKPVVILNYDNNDNENYLRYEGAIFGAEEYGSLTNIIKNLVNGNLKVDNQVQDHFINQFSKVSYGKVCENYIEYIKRTLG